MPKPLLLKKVSLIVDRVLYGESLSNILLEIKKEETPQDQSLIYELSYGTIRYYYRLNTWLRELMNKPLSKKDSLLHHLILVGIYQLYYTRIPHHACIGETVNTVNNIGKKWAKALVNAILRNFLRKKQHLESLQDQTSNKQILECIYAHPNWMIQHIKNIWPNDWKNILTNNNNKAPMTLRVNTKKISRDEYITNLSKDGIKSTKTQHSKEGIHLEKPINIHELFGFQQGFVSVQDESAQITAELLPIKRNQHVLDACCAPGGKTAHILEKYDSISMDAIDICPNRLAKVKENLTRLQLDANIIAADIINLNQWFSGQLYDHILLDAPCSGTGVIRRHPDIKLLRKKSDFTNSSLLQKKMLEVLWPLIKKEGYLLYTTCSILKEENSEQIKLFLNHHNDAKLIDINNDIGIDTGFGCQRLPSLSDGFFYSLLQKKS